MATFEFKLPDLGEGVMEGEIVNWNVKPGDMVKEDDVLCEVMTDKATVTVPSPTRGKVVATHGKVGEMAKVHQVLVTFESEGAAPAASAAQPQGNGAGSDTKVLATPVTRRMAREHGLNLAEISGSGPQGRVTKADVMAALEGGGKPASNQVVVP